MKTTMQFPQPPDHQYDLSDYFPEMKYLEPTNGLGGPSIPLKQHWTHLTKLRWESAIGRAQGGGHLNVDKAGLFTFYVYGLGCSWSEMTFEQAWDHINAFQSGVRAGKRLAIKDAE